jgi:predicted PurR-regulated permease PerM
MEEANLKQIMIWFLLGSLFLLSFFLLQPILLSILLGLVLAFMFTPVYSLLFRWIKNGTVVALIICFILVLIILLPIILLTPVLIQQSIKIYVASQQLDFITPLKKIFPSLFLSAEFSLSIANTIQSFVTDAANSLMNSFAQIIKDIPTIVLELVIVFFTMFYALRDKEKIINYIKSILPFSSEVETKLFRATRDVTSSVIFGMIIVGILQGVITGIGFFIFGIPNALLLSLFAILAGILPIIGPAVIWVPVVIYLLIGGNTFASVGVIIFGILSHIPDYLVRPLFLSKRTQLNAGVASIGMIGGILFLGVLGIIIGPLILSYLLIVLELFKKKVSQ